MAILGSMTKQPNEILDFDIDYSTVLANRSDTLTSPTVAITVVTGGTTDQVTAPTPTISGNKVKVVVSGGLDSATYKATVSVSTTPAGLKYEDEVTIVVQDT
jgi:hypothetical protein